MSDIKVSVGLDTAQALKDSKTYIDALNDIVAVSKKLEKKLRIASAEVKKQGQETSKSAKNTKELQEAVKRLEKSYDPLGSKLKKVLQDRKALNTAQNMGLVSSSKAAVLASKLSAEYERLSAAQSKNTGSTKKIIDSTKQHTDSVNRQNAAMGKSIDLWGTLKRAVGVYLGLNLARNLIDVNNKMIGLNSALQVITGSQQGAAQSMKFIKDTAEELGLEIIPLADSYKQLTAAAKGANFPMAESDRVFKAIATTSRALNLSTEDTKGAIRALSQSMSKGTVQAEELRGQLGERIPGAFGLAAKAMGMTTAELGKALELGQVMAADMLPKLAVELEKAFPADASATDNMAANIARMNNAFVELATVMGEAGLNEAIKELTKDITAFAKSDEAVELAELLGETVNFLSDAVRFLAENWEALAVLLGVNLFSKLALLIESAVISVTTFSTATAGATASVTMLGAAIRVAIPLVGLLTGAYLAGKALAETETGKTVLNTIFGEDEDIRKKTELLEALNTSIEKAKSDNKEATLAINKAGAFATQAEELKNSLEIIGAADVTAKIREVEQAIADIGKVAENTKPALEKLNSAGLAHGMEWDTFIQKLKESTKATDFLKNVLADLNVTLTKVAARDKLAKDVNDIIKKFDQLTKKVKPTDKALKDIIRSWKISNVLTAKQIKDLDAAANAYDKLKQEAEALANAETRRSNAIKDNEVIAALGEELSMLYATNEERAEYNNLQKLSATATEEAVEAVKKLTKEILAKNKAEKDAADTLALTKKLTQETDSLADSFLRVGDNMEGAFGSVVDQLNKLAQNEKKFAEQSIKNSEALAKAQELARSGDTEAREEANRLTQAQAELDVANTNARLGQLSKIASATASGFKEGSKAAKAFTLVAQGLALAQAIAAIANQGLGDPYTAFARIAAMIGIMSSIGLTVGGGGGSAPSISEQRQESQGTGTILGDASAKSESIVNALERLEKVDLEQYIELRGIFHEMVDLNRNITRFSAGLVRSFGTFTGQGFSSHANLGTDYNASDRVARQIGEGSLLETLTNNSLGGLFDSIFETIGHALFGKTKRTLVDSGIKFFSQTFSDILTGGINAVAYADIKTKKKKLFGLSSSTSYSQEQQTLDAEAERQLTAIFVSMGETITEALDILGIDAAHSLESFVLNLGEISLEGLSGEEIQAELEAIFSQQGDLMALHVLPSLVELQEVGEGLFETLMRVAIETATFEQGLKAIGVGLAQFSDMTGEEFLFASQAAIDAAGGIEAYQEAITKFTSEVLDGSDLLALAASNAKKLSETELADIGFSLETMPDLDAFRSAFEAIKGTLSPEEIVEWVQAGNALADLDSALNSFADSVESMIKPFKDLREDISEIIQEIEGDLRTSSSVNSRLTDARSNVASLVGGYNPFIAPVVPTYPPRDGWIDLPKPPREIFAPDNTSDNLAFEKFMQKALRKVDLLYPGQQTGTTSTAISLVADPEEQLAALTELKDAILDNYDYQMQLIDEEREGIENLISVAEQFKSSVSSFLDTLGNDIKKLEELAPNFDEALTRSQELAQLQQEYFEGTGIDIRNGYNPPGINPPAIDLFGSKPPVLPGNDSDLENKIKLTRTEELALLDKLRQAVLSNYEAQKRAIQNDFAERRNLLTQEMEQRRSLIKEDFAARRKAAQDTITSLQKQHSERVTQENDLANLRSQLSQALQDEAQASAEAARQRQQDAMQAAFDAAQELYEAWKAVSESITSFLDSLDLSALSPLTNQERLDNSQNRFEELLGKALSGDVDAASSLTDASQAYLTEARSFYASSDSYNEIYKLTKKQLESVDSLARTFKEPAPLAVGDQAIVDSVSNSSENIRAQIRQLETTLAASESADVLANQIAAQEDLLAQLSDEETATLEALSQEQEALLLALSEQESAALEQLRQDTLAELEPLRAAADALNALVEEELLNHQATLVTLEERAAELQEETISELQNLNALIEQLEAARENSAREEFDALITANNANTDRIVDAINTSTPPADSTPPPVVPPVTPPYWDDNNINIHNQQQYSDMVNLLDSINRTLNGSNGGAVIQPIETNIETV